MSYSSEVLADSPLVYYRLGEASGTTMTDSSGNGRDGGYFNGVTLGTTGLLATSSDTAASFNGTSSVGITSNAAWMDFGSALTVEAWIQTTATNYREIVAQYSGTSNRAFEFRIDSATGAINFIKLTGSTVSVIGTTSVRDGAAHHVAATFDGANIRLYVDGVLDKTQAATGTLSGTTADLRIGDRAGALYFSGVLDEIALYGTTLSDTRIAAHYAAGAPPATTSGTLAATLPKPTISLSGTYIARETGTLSVSLPKPTVALAGTYTAPANPTGTFDAVLPLPTVALSGDYFPHETGSFAVTLPKPTVSLAGTYTAPPHPTGLLGATLPLPTVALVGTYTGPIPTDTSNAFDGLDVAPFGHATITHPAAAVPATLALAEKYDKAVPYPVPVMSGGRPT